MFEYLVFDILNKNVRLYIKLCIRLVTNTARKKQVKRVSGTRINYFRKCISSVRRFVDLRGAIPQYFDHSTTQQMSTKKTNRGQAASDSRSPNSLWSLLRRRVCRYPVVILLTSTHYSDVSILQLFFKKRQLFVYIFRLGISPITCKKS